MSSSLLHPPGHLSAATALKLSQQAPAILKSTKGASSATTLQSLLGSSETPELWTIYENLLLSCLRTGDGQSAYECLARLVGRFGDDHERILALKGILKEADAQDNSALELILKEYDQTLQENPTNLPIAKRRVALLRSMDKISEAVTALNSLLEVSPTDAEAWSELSDMYSSQGLYPQAIFALEEVVVLQPNAWNIHARLGELLLMSSDASGQAPALEQVSEAVKRFCRSIELCDDYLRGYYGLKMAVKQLLGEPQKKSKQAEYVPDEATLRGLDEVATTKLAEIVRRSSSGEKGWQGYDASEVEAARGLLGKDSDTRAR